VSSIADLSVIPTLADRGAFDDIRQP